MRQAIIASALIWLSAAPAAAQWVRVESPNFVVFGELGEKSTREFAAEFERFREALGRVVPQAAERPAAPAIIFIFKDAKSFSDYRPLYNGKPVDVSGYFAGGAALDVIMLPATSRETALRVVFHEYSHLITLNQARSLPAWLAEGLAEYLQRVPAPGRWPARAARWDRSSAHPSIESRETDTARGTAGGGPGLSPLQRRSTAVRVLCAVLGAGAHAAQR